ncbi:MAG: U32 family peptidase [Clostridiales bacterium]|nr:U32 family peptidase [Clostridiales bacterium]
MKQILKPMNEKRVELLAPVGDMSCFYAAINHGADAVYLGASRFGARSSAGFDDESLHTAIRTAHLFGKRVYVAFNTLIKQDELDEAKLMLAYLNGLNADAVIIQDLGLLRLIKQHLPQLPVHASTQMSIHNVSGAKTLINHGVNRVVLARECNIQMIGDVAASGIETEVFVHGALCISVSGQCLLSSQIGGRSGNRGRCAQPCRLLYEYRGKKGAWLSPRDIALIDRIPDLIQAGVTSLKIEGRLKSQDYVATVTKIYRKAIDQFYEGNHQPVIISDKQALLQSFNRGGFSQGWVFGQPDADIINPERVSHDGLPLGIVLSSKQTENVFLSMVKLSTNLTKGDQLQIRGFIDQEMIYSGPQQTTGDTAIIRHYKKAKPGDRVFKLVDANLVLKTEKNSLKPNEKLHINASLNVRPDHAAQLTLTRNGVTISVKGDIVQTAQSQPMSRDSTIRAIQKTGDSPFLVDNFELTTFGDCFLSVSSINALRRNALLKMEESIISSYQRDAALPSNPDIYQVAFNAEEALYIKSHRIELIQELRRVGPVHFIYAPQDYTSPDFIENCMNLDRDDYIYFPKQLSDTTLNMLQGVASKLNIGIYADNISHLNPSVSKNMIAGNGIPVWNTESINWIRDRGCKATVASHELSKNEVQSLANERIPMILPVYGRTEVMTLNHCPERSYRGLFGSQTSCRLCDANQGTRGQSLKDRMNADFPLFPTRLSEGCLNTLLFHTPLNLSKKSFGKQWLLNFTTEEDTKILEVLHYYASLLKGINPSPKLPAPLFAGRFDKGVV